MKNIFRKTVLLLCLFFIGDYIIFSVLKKGMDSYYGMGKKAEVLLVGHSHTVLGVDAEKMERKLGVPVAKYATAGANTLDRFWMLRQFVEEHPSVKKVIYDVDPRLFDSEGLSSASYTLFLPYLGNPAIAEYLKNEAGWQEYYSSKFIRTSRFRDQTLNIALRGLLGKIENSKSSSIRVENYRGYFEREQGRRIRINPESVQCFRKSVNYLTEKDIEVYLVFIPVIDLLNEIDPVNQKKVVAIFESTAERDNVHFLDYNGIYQHNHELFYDLRHLNYKGKTEVTSRLIDDLKGFKGRAAAMKAMDKYAVAGGEYEKDPL